MTRRPGTCKISACLRCSFSALQHFKLKRFEENQSLIGEWNLEAPDGVRGYTKLVVPKTTSEKIKAGLAEAESRG